MDWEIYRATSSEKDKNWRTLLNERTASVYCVGFRGNFKYGSRTPLITIWSARIAAGASNPTPPPDVT